MSLLKKGLKPMYVDMIPSVPRHKCRGYLNPHRFSVISERWECAVQTVLKNCFFYWRLSAFICGLYIRLNGHYLKHRPQRKRVYQTGATERLGAVIELQKLIPEAEPERAAGEEIRAHHLSNLIEPVACNAEA